MSLVHSVVSVSCASSSASTSLSSAVASGAAASAASASALARVAGVADASDPPRYDGLLAWDPWAATSTTPSSPPVQAMTTKDDDEDEENEEDEAESHEIRAQLEDFYNATNQLPQLGEMTLRIDVELEKLRRRCFAERNAQWQFATPEQFEYVPKRTKGWQWHPLSSSFGSGFVGHHPPGSTGCMATANDEDALECRGEFVRDRTWPPKQFMARGTFSKPARASRAKRKGLALLAEPTPVCSRICTFCGIQESCLWRKRRELEPPNDGDLTSTVQEAMEEHGEMVCQKCFVERRYQRLFAQERAQQIQQRNELAKQRLVRMEHQRVAAERIRLLPRPVAAPPTKRSEIVAVQCIKEEDEGMDMDLEDHLADEVDDVTTKAEPDELPTTAAATGFDALAHDESSKVERNHNKKSSKRDRKKSKHSKKHKHKRERPYQQATVDVVAATTAATTAVATVAAVATTGVVVVDAVSSNGTNANSCGSSRRKRNRTGSNEHSLAADDVAKSMSRSSSHLSLQTASGGSSAASCTPLGTASTPSTDKKRQRTARKRDLEVASESITSTITTPTTSRSKRRRSEATLAKSSPTTTASSPAANLAAVSAAAFSKSKSNPKAAKPNARSLVSLRKRGGKMTKHTPREQELRELGQYCPVCNQVYENDDQSTFVCCDSCEMWVHSDCDTMLTPELVATLANSSEKYICPLCSGR